jgi:hypothetical protein
MRILFDALLDALRADCDDREERNRQLEPRRPAATKHEEREGTSRLSSSRDEINHTAPGDAKGMPTGTQLELALAELFANRGEEMPLWLELRSKIEGFGGDVKLEVRERYAAFDRGGEEFAITEPAAHRRLVVGLHNPGLPFDNRFREAVEFGSRRITHRVTLAETAPLDDELRARLRTAYLLAYDGEPR